MLLYALLGFVVGVLINHAADILPQRRSPWQAPQCPSCQKRRHPLEWSGLISFLVGRRRCAHCGVMRGLRAPLVELITALLFALLWAKYGPTLQLAFFTVYTVAFVLLFVIDLEHRLILNVVILPAILFALVSGFLRTDLNYRLVLMGGVVGAFISLLLYFGGPLFVRLWSRLRGETTTEVPFGFGDVNLSLFIGLVVGFPGVVFALLIGIFLGGVGAALLLLGQALLRKRYQALTAIPYGPFLITGALLVLFGGPRLLAAFLGG